MNPLKRKLETTATHLKNGQWSALGDKARRNVGAIAAPVIEAGTLLRDAYTFRRWQHGKGSQRIAIAPSLGADIRQPQGRKKNVIWIMLDALRADVFHTFLERGGMASLGQANSLYFPRAFAQGSWTYPSLFSFLTARYPFNCGVSRITAEGDTYLSLCTDFDESCPTIFSLLRQNGYRVGSILDGWGFTIRNTAGQEHREDRYFERNWGWMYGQDQRFLTLEEQRDASVSFIRQSATDGPFFLFLRSLYTHSPYRDIFPSSDYVTTLSRRRWQFRLVEGFVRGLQTFEEVYLQALVDTLQELNQLDNTLIILCSDHGDMFWNVEDDLRASHSSAQLTSNGVADDEVWRHQLEPYNALTKVPLFMWGAGASGSSHELPSNGVYRERFRLMDVVPTILDELGIAYERQAFDGISLFRDGARPLYADSAGYGNGGIAFQAGGPKLMMSSRLGAVRYDIQDHEYETLAKRNGGLKTVSRSFRREAVADFEAFLQQAAREPQTIAASLPGEEDTTGHEDALMRRLQALGYI